MDAGLAVAGAQVDPEDYYLDLDADAGVEEFDFKLDGAYENETAQEGHQETDSGVAANPEAAFEIGYEDDPTHPGPSEAGPRETTEAAQDVGEDNGMEYQDEIGYEDEEPVTADAITNPEPGGTTTPSAGQSAVASEGHEHKSFDDIQMHEPELQTVVHLDLDSEEPTTELLAQDGLEDLGEEDMSQVDANAGLSAGATDAESTHQSLLSHGVTPVSGLDNAEDAPFDISDDSLILPTILVLYNQALYSLVGEPGDDPEMYFLSDPKELENPLSHFLASIRAVISDEISPEDELLIRIATLGLEFGERSSKKFLDRTFRDIITCFTTLESKHPENASHTLDLEIFMRQDCETRFTELLQEAGLAPTEISGQEETLEGVEDSTSNEVDDGKLVEESPADEYSEEYEQEGEDGANTTDHDNVSQAAAGDERWPEPETAPENGDDIMGESFDLQENVDEHESAELAPLDPAGEGIYEEQYLEVQYDEYDNTAEAEGDENFVSGDEDVSGQDEELAADDTPEEPELAFDLPGQPIKQQDTRTPGDLEIEKGGLAVDETAAAGDHHDSTEAGSALHDFDVTLMLDQDSTLATLPELNSMGGNDAGGVGQSVSAVPADATNEDHPEDSREAISGHTSRTSTVDGDEIDYDEQNQGEEPFAEDGGIHPEAKTLGEKRDEIDWETYGDEDDEQAAAGLTPSSLSGKRSRTNEAESLEDETDYKRRRT